MILQLFILHKIHKYFSYLSACASITLPCPGISAHQKLDLLSGLVTPLGYEGLSVFGDCFDEVTLLDPVRFPGTGFDR